MEKLIADSLAEFEEKFIDEYYLKVAGNKVVSADVDDIKSFLATHLEQAFLAGQKAKGSSWREGYQKGFDDGVQATETQNNPGII